MLKKKDRAQLKIRVLQNVVGVTKLNWIRSEDIREKLGQESVLEVPRQGPGKELEVESDEANRKLG